MPSLDCSPAGDIGSWASYTPTWISAGTDPAIGNGTLAGHYRVVGDSCQVRIRLDTGSTTTYGGDSWQFGIPSGITKNIPAGEEIIGSAHARRDDSPTTRYSGTSLLLATTDILAHFLDNLSIASSTQPFAWNEGDRLNLFIEFPITP